MKTLRFVPVLSLILAALISLTGCVVIPRYKNYDDINRERLSSVDIYDLRNSETHYSDFLKTETPVYTLTNDQLDSFFSDLADIRFTDHIIIVLAAVDPSFWYDDWVVRINYTDGSYSLISCGGYGENYDVNNQAVDSNHYGCDDDEWQQFIGKYVPKDIFESQEQVP